MRILAITNQYPNVCQPQRATHNRQHFRSLASFHQLKVVAPISWTDELRAGIVGGRWLPRSRRSNTDGVEAIHPRYYFPPGLLRSWYGHCFLKSVRSTVMNVARDFRPELLLGSWAYPDGYAAVRLAREMRIPAAVHVLGSDLNLLDKYPARGPATWKTLQAADGVITSSQHLADQVTASGIDQRRVSVVYRGIDKDMFFPGSQPEAQNNLQLNDAYPVLLFIGNLVPVKAVDVLITACSQLVSQFPKLQCHVVGDGPLRKQLQAQAVALSIASHVHFHGVVQHSQLPCWYHAADLIVLPSLSEGVPNVLRESIATARPYVASATGGIPEISHHEGCRLVPPGDTSALADAIIDQLQDGRAPDPASVSTETWDQAGHNLAQVLENIVRRHHHQHVGSSEQRNPSRITPPAA